MDEEIHLVSQAFVDGFSAGVAFGRLESLSGSISTDRLDAWILWKMIYLREK